VSVRSIRTESDYQAALGEVAALMGSDPTPRTPEGDRLDALVTLLQVYVARHLPAAGAEGAGPGEGDGWVNRKLTFSKESRIFFQCPFPPKPRATSGIR